MYRLETSWGMSGLLQKTSRKAKEAAPDEAASGFKVRGNLITPL
jgi:hypothetical protein